MFMQVMRTRHPFTLLPVLCILDSPTVHLFDPTSGAWSRLYPPPLSAQAKTIAAVDAAACAAPCFNVIAGLFDGGALLIASVTRADVGDSATFKLLVLLRVWLPPSSLLADARANADAKGGGSWLCECFSAIGPTVSADAPAIPLPTNDIIGYGAVASDTLLLFTSPPSACMWRLHLPTLLPALFELMRLRARARRRAVAEKQPSVQALESRSPTGDIIEAKMALGPTFEPAEPNVGAGANAADDSKNTQPRASGRVSAMSSSRSPSPYSPSPSGGPVRSSLSRSPSRSGHGVRGSPSRMRGSVDNRVVRAIGGDK
jgi:hypothetical protein